MRRLVLPLLALAFVTGPARAQTQWADKLFMQDGGSTKHDFGTVPRGTQLKHAFTMKNIYKVPLEITEVKPSCGCLTYTMSTKVIPPGETATLNINMDGTRFNGHKIITVRVTVGPEYVSSATLTVTANARFDVTFTPSEIDFGLVQRGQTPTKSIDVEYFGGQAWQVSEIVKTASCPFDLKVEDLKGRRGYRIFATLRADAQPGQFRHEIILKTNDTASPVLTFNAVGNVLASLKASPANVTLASKVGEKKSRKVVISGSQAFKILGVDGQGDGVTAHFDDGEDSTQYVDVRFEPTKAGDHKKQLVVRTSLGKETVTISVDASGSP